MIEQLHAIGLEIVGSIRVELIRYLAGAAGVAVLYWLVRHWIAHRRIQTRRATQADRWREFGQSVQTICMFAVVNLITYALFRAGIIPAHRGAPVAWMVAWQIVAMVILHDAYFYWMHRTLHLRALFRMAHATHHRSRTPTSWAAYSFAPGEAVFEAIYIPIMFLALSWIAPLERWAVFLFLGHQIARNAIGHSGFELAWPGFTRSALTGWLTTTTHHDLHHSEGRYNFGLYFTWWDRWLGTEHPQYHARFDAVVTSRSDLAQASA